MNSDPDGSLDKSERVPFSRKRSCEECIESKRRCDREFPVCSRCRKRGFACEYANKVAVQAVTRRRTRSPFSPKASYVSELDELLMPTYLACQNGNMYSGSLQSQLATYHPTTNLDFSMTDLLDIDMLPDSPASSLDSPEVSWGAGGGLIPSDVMSRIHLIDWSLISSLKSFKLMPSDSSPLGTNRTEFDLYGARIKQFPTAFLRKSSTAFLHPRFYSQGLPPILQTTLAVCSLSETSRSTRGKSATLQKAALEDLLANMTFEFKVTDSLHVKLARTHAFLIVLSLRLFSGDIRQSSQGERMLTKLCLILDHLTEWNLTSSGHEPAHNPQEEWENWIQQETLNRTVLVGLMIQCAYLPQRYGVQLTYKCDRLRMGLCKGMWQATSVEEWVSARQQFAAPYESQDAREAFTQIDDADKFDYDGLLWICSEVGLEAMEDKLHRDLRSFPEFVEFDN